MNTKINKEDLEKDFKDKIRQQKLNIISIKARRGQLISYEDTCEFCFNKAFKTNGNSEFICESRAISGSCLGYVPFKHKKQPQQRNDLCNCGSGKKFKKCCINKIKDMKEDKEISEDLNLEVEPECTASPEEIEDSGIECEYNKRNGQWWCTTHNCSA